MAKPLPALLVGLILAACAACGRKGPLALPVSQVPMGVEGLMAVPGDGTVLLTWTNPAKTVAGKPLGPLGAVEIWVFDRILPAGNRAPRPDEVETTARLVRRIRAEEFAGFRISGDEGTSRMAFSFTLGPGPAGSQRLAFTVRVFDAKGRASDYSAPVAFPPDREEAGVDRPAAKGVS